MTVTDLALAERQVWGESRFTALAPDGAAVAIDVIGRDAADARLFAKVWRSIWYKDSGPSLALHTRSSSSSTARTSLLLAERTGVPVSEVVIAGIGGRTENAVLVLARAERRAARRRSLAERDHRRRARRRVANLGAAARGTRIAHGSSTRRTCSSSADGTTAFVDFAHASPHRAARTVRVDAVALLVDHRRTRRERRALAAAQRALGRDGLADLLPLLNPAALPDGRARDRRRKKL